MVYWYFIVHLQFLFAGLIPCLGKLDFFLKNITDPYFLQTKKKRSSVLTRPVRENHRVTGLFQF